MASGHARRRRDDVDRRRVLVEHTDSARRDGAAAFLPLSLRISGALTPFTAEELRAALRVIEAATAALQAPRDAPAAPVPG